MIILSNDRLIFITGIAIPVTGPVVRLLSVVSGHVGRIYTNTLDIWRLQLRRMPIANISESAITALASASFHILISIITLVRHKKARFDSKMHGSTPKSLVRHKNARFDTKMPSPACTSWHCHDQTPTPVRIFFPILFQFFVFRNQ